MASTTPNAKPASARAGVLSAKLRCASAKAARNPFRRARERSLSFVVRIVSGIQACPRDAGRCPPHRPRIAGLYPQGESCRKSPDRERARFGRDLEKWAPLFGQDHAPDKRAERYFSASARFAMSSTLIWPSAAENVRSASISTGRTTLLTGTDAGRNRFEMVRRKLMARGQRLRRQRP